jgi:DNA-binding CsgD family transcriptional regulator
MLSLVLDIKNIIQIIVNGILLLYISVPLYGYNLFGVPKKYYKLIPVLVITDAVVENVLMAHNIYSFLYLPRVFLYILFLVPIFIHTQKYKKDSLEGTMQNVTKKTVIIFLIFMIAFIPFSMFLFEISYVPSLWWAVFTLSYQIPGLVYCKKYLFNKGIAVGKTGLLLLSKRENEVALAICSGLKYEEIAGNLFITLSSVKKHSFNIYRKLGINNNRELLHIFMESQEKAPNEPVLQKSIL